MPPRVLLVANRTSTAAPLFDAVRRRAARGPVAFHLVIPATPGGLHRLVDPEVAGMEAARRRLGPALEALTAAAGQTVTGHVGDANPLAAVADAVNLLGFDEIILSTLPWKVSQWLRIDLPRKVSALGLPVLHVCPTGPGAPEPPPELGGDANGSRRHEVTSPAPSLPVA